MILPMRLHVSILFSMLLLSTTIIEAKKELLPFKDQNSTVESLNTEKLDEKTDPVDEEIATPGSPQWEEQIVHRDYDRSEQQWP